MMFVSFIIVLIVVSSVAALNDWPIIGIVAQPSTSTEGNCNGKCEYIAASYVKYIEAAGARVVPISYYSTNKQIDTLFQSLDGFFIPGGGSAFPPSVQYIYDKVVDANKRGDFIPLWGTCMGFQWLLIAQSRDSNILDPKGSTYDAYNYSIPLDFAKDAHQSKMFSKASDELMAVLATQNVTMNNHHYGIYPDHFYATPSLSSFFKVISTNVDRNGLPFVSTMESYDYPIFGAQWHPEKNNFEWGKTNGIPNEAINHSPDAILVSNYMADFFVQQARHCNHSYANPSTEDSSIIENYVPSKTTGSFMQTYFFHF